MDTFYIIIALLLLGAFVANPVLERFRKNRQREQRKWEKYHLT